MMRKLAAAFLGLLLCIALTGCGPSEKQRAVYNDDSLIAAQSDTYFYVKHLSTQSGTEYTENFGSFTGSDTLWSRNAKEGQTPSRFRQCGDKRRQLEAGAGGSGRERERIAGIRRDG